MSAIPSSVDYEKAWKSFEQTWLQGRKVLVIIGAGASVASKVPRMTQIFGDLRERVERLVRKEALVKECRDAKKDFGIVCKHLEEMAIRLKALENEHAPRSDASIVLGSLQRAGERLREGPLQKHLHDLWIHFTNDFISGRIGATKGKRRRRISSLEPSGFHKMIARWVANRQATAISLNFDGLTASALRSELKPLGSGVGVVISRPAELQQFFLGEIFKGPAAARGLVPIIKIWGDVFHAVCKNPQCPEFDKKIPAYDLGKINSKATVNDSCPTCKAPRQLQIFFTGYEEKERSANELMHQMIRFVAPEIGCILTVGFSGLWDRALVDFLCLLAADLQREDRNRRGLALQGIKWSPSPVWINVDPRDQPPLHQEISAHGVSLDHLYHLPVKSEDFRQAVEMRMIAELPISGDRYDKNCLNEGLWEEMIHTSETHGAAEKTLPSSYEHLISGNYLYDFGRLRQIGIKTRISNEPNPASPATEDSAHNRLRHSSGAAHLAIVWFRKLAKEARTIGLLKASEEEWLASTVLYAALHHDIGHIPFSHLSEEVFAEVRWTLEEWGDPFRHDQPVLASCIQSFQKEIFAATAKAIEPAKAAGGFDDYVFRTWIESAIQGRTGRHWVDAILNSPLDADKLDYVFRDCHFLKQGLHLPLVPDQRQEWVRVFFENTRLLPSGLVALEGPAGDRAREFLEERCWLYKHQYYDPGFRAVERLCSAVILHWLLHTVPLEIVNSESMKEVWAGKASIGDTSSLKGQQARDLLWREMRAVQPNEKGEPELILRLADHLIALADKPAGLPPARQMKGWAIACRAIFQKAFTEYSAKSSASLLEYLTQRAGMSCSEIAYVQLKSLEKVRDVVRELETSRPFGTLFDIALLPSVLSYPSRRRLFKSEGMSIAGECFAVSDRDPERWSRSTGSWIPLSASAFGERDKYRWIRIMAVSPFPDDPSVPHAMDRFRDMCRIHSIEIREVDPDYKR